MLYRILRIFLLLILSNVSFTYGINQVKNLQDSLKQIIQKTDARIGVAVIINGTDTIMVNGNQYFPMMSVFKFPLALTVADLVEATGASFNDSIIISTDDLKEIPTALC